MAEHDKCILMFSGGRDSTLAAIELAKTFTHLVLVTISSDHLVGMEKVERRVQELATYLPVGTEWMQVSQPTLLNSETLLGTTCLPCHREYNVAGILLSQRLHIHNLAFGYVGYQSSWPEQTLLATERLTSILATVNINLVLPVYHISSKERAIGELARLGLSSESLEQKCLKQVFNIELEAALLEKEVERWESSVLSQIKSLGRIQLDITSTQTLEQIKKSNGSAR